MPVYQYECTSCGKKFEIFQDMTAAPLKKCPNCGADVHRVSTVDNTIMPQRRDRF